MKSLRDVPAYQNRPIPLSPSDALEFILRAESASVEPTTYNGVAEDKWHLVAAIVGHVGDTNYDQDNPRAPKRILPFSQQSPVGRLLAAIPQEEYPFIFKVVPVKTKVGNTFDIAALENEEEL